EGVDRFGRIRRCRIRMNSNLAEINPQSRLHKSACRRIERLAWPAQDVVNDGWRCRSGRAAVNLFHAKRPCRLEGFAALTLLAFTAAAASPLDCRFRHAHNLFRNAVGFPLILITRLVDSQFGLNYSSRAEGSGARMPVSAPF